MTKSTRHGPSADGAAALVASGGPPVRRRRRRGGAFPYLLALPSFILFLGVIAFPFVQSLAYGFFKRSLLSDASVFVGMDNVVRQLSSPTFWRDVGNTVVFVGASTAGAFVIALALALALNSGIAGAAAWRTAFLLPWILPGVVVSFLWMWMFDTNYGLLNGVIVLFGGAGGINWLNSPTLAMAAVVMAKIWHSFPWMTILLLAALQGVPSEVHDASAVDGATGWRKQWYVILPQIKAAIALTILLETIWGLQHFEIPYVMTGGGPVGSTTTLSIALYKTAFSKFDLGNAGAIGVLWTVLMAGMIVVYVVYTLRQEEKATGT